MKKKFCISSIVLLATFFTTQEATQVWAEQGEGGTDQSWSVSGEVELASRGVSSYTGGQLPEALAKPSVTLSHNPSGVYVNMIGYANREEMNEVDFLGGLATEVGGVQVDTGVGFYDLKSYGEAEGNLFAIYLGAEFPEVFGITPLTYVEGNMPTDADVLGGGWLWKVGAKKIVDIGEQPIQVEGWVGGNDGVYDSEPKLLSFASVTVSTPMEIMGVTVTPALTLQKGFGGIAEENYTAVAGLTFSF
ncbi:MAG: hypothetical protein WC823_06360 [Parcubacteria group bacterium]|jgi:hypothetical protein